MKANNLVNGKKEELLKIFSSLKQVHGKKWHSKLRLHNNWHATVEGYYAWQNASKGTVGNEPLRLIISDMQEVIAKTSKQSIKRLGLSRQTKV